MYKKKLNDIDQSRKDRIITKIVDKVGDCYEVGNNIQSIDQTTRAGQEGYCITMCVGGGIETTSYTQKQIFIHAMNISCVEDKQL